MIFRIGLRLSFLFIAAALSLPVFAQDKAECEKIAQAVEEAANKRDQDAMATQFRAAQSNPVCGSEFTFCLGRRIALSYLEDVYARRKAGQPAVAARSLIERALAYGRPWQLSVAAGELEVQAERTDATRFSRAALHYQNALGDLGEKPICAGESDLLPSPEQVQIIYRHAVVSYLLSPTLVEAPKNRCGEESQAWLFVGSVCGFAPESRPLPVQFNYKATTLTDKGKKTVGFLVDHLKRSGATKISLTGHTDAKGSDDYNLKLSKERLDAVAKALKAGGYKGEIALEAKGKSEPFPLDSPERYTQAEIDEINRRVEFRVGG